MSLFPTPEIIVADPIFSLPEKYRKTGVKTTWADCNRGGVAVDSFLEGPSFDRQGNLYVVDIPFGRIFRISPDGSFELSCEYDGQPNGLKIHKDGRIFIADYKNGIMVLDPDSGDIQPILADNNSERFKGCNDLHFGQDGALYFTDQGQTGLHDPSGRVYRWYESTGRLDCLINNVPSPNGLVLDLTEKNLYLAVTRANAIWRLPMRNSGGISKAGLYLQLSGGRSGPDGLALDQDGRLFVCHAGLGTVWVFDQLGRPAYAIQVDGELGTTNCAFGGQDRKSLYIVESDTGRIFMINLDISGQLMYGMR